MLKHLLIVISVLLMMVSTSKAQTVTDIERIRQILTNGSEITFYSLEPVERIDPTQESLRLGTWKILGKTVLGKKEYSVVSQEFIRAMDSWNSRDRMAMCFNPRQALKVTYENKTWVVALCFECNRIQAYTSKGEQLNVPATGNGDTLNQLLKSKKIPISNSDHE